MDIGPDARRRRFGELVRRVRAVVDVDVTFGGLVDTPGDRFVIDALDGAGTHPLSGLDIHKGAGLGGKAMVLVRPATVADYPTATGITHHYDREVAAANLRSVFAIPVAPRGVPRAVVYGALRTPSSFGDDLLSAAHRAVQRFETDLIIEDEVRSRLNEAMRDTRDPSAAGMREQLRELHAELSSIAAQIDDPTLRERLTLACDRVPVQGAGSALPGADPGAPGLTNRETEVLVQVAAGCTNVEVARRLGLVTSTVKAYLKSAMRKLGARNRVEAVTAARRVGLIP